MGFHASQEAARVLAESIDYSRQGQVAAQRALVRPGTQPATQPTPSVEGVMPAGKHPPGADTGPRTAAP